MKNPNNLVNRPAITYINIFLKLLYEDSEVTSGEFIHSVKLPKTYKDQPLTEFQIRRGIKSFLDWDESEEIFDVNFDGEDWVIGYPMDSIRYKNKDYRVRTFNVNLIGEDWEGTYKIAEDELYDAIHEDDKEEGDDLIDQSEEFHIDNEIYHYVENGILDLPAEEICLEHLDIPMELIEEIKY
jgi:hypothetical protein